tara:strand:- start:87 stop:413 length:327 start_codon:yes stop_codon:yes gene_type:complete
MIDFRTVDLTDIVNLLVVHVGDGGDVEVEHDVSKFNDFIISAADAGDFEIVSLDEGLKRMREYAFDDEQKAELEVKIIEFVGEVEKSTLTNGQFVSWGVEYDLSLMFV